MRRPIYSFAIEVYDLITKSFKSFKKHKMLPAYWIAFFLILLSIFFIFISYVQTISPFVYPLF
jgi:hypothetical protein